MDFFFVKNREKKIDVSIGKKKIGEKKIVIFFSHDFSQKNAREKKSTFFFHDKKNYLKMMKKKFVRGKKKQFIIGEKPCPTIHRQSYCPQLAIPMD